MADPLSVAGLAAGLVSLGLQVCGGIMQYMDALDCREQDIASVRQQNVSLRKTLQVVETSLSRLEHDHHAATEVVHKCIDSCKKELEALVSLMAELAPRYNQSLASRRDKIKNQSKKLLYPFSRPKLQQLETTLRNVNATLHLALQALGLSVSQSSAEKLAMLESTSNNISASLLVVQSNVSAMSTPLLGINSALSAIHTRFDSLEHAVTQLLVEGPTIGRRSQKITSKSTSSRNSRSVKARVHEKACGTARVRANDTSSSWLIATAPGEDGFHTLVSSFLGNSGTCICRLSRVRKRSDFFWGPLGFYRETTTQEHLPECPVSQMVGTDWSQRFGLKYTGLQSLLDSAVQLSLTIHSGAGGWAMSPHLTYYPTVDPNTAPAFRALSLLQNSLYKLVPFEDTYRPVPQWEKLVALALTKILKSFQTRKASPLAVDSVNQSLAHFAAQCIQEALRRERPDLAQPLIELLKYLIKHKVPSNGYSLSGSSPLGMMISGYYDSTKQHVDASLFILESNSEVTPAHLSQAPPVQGVGSRRDEPLYQRGPIHRVVRFLSCSPRIAEAYGCGPLSLAVLANDSAQVEYLLKHHPTALGERNQLGQSPLHLAVERLECLGLLLQAADSKLLNDIDCSGISAVETAILLSGSVCQQGNRRRKCRRCHCAKTLQLFLRADCALPLITSLQSLLRAASHRCRLRYTRAVRDRRERLKHLALTTLASIEAECLGFSGDGILDAHAVKVIQLLERRDIRVPDALHVFCPTPAALGRLPWFSPLRSVYSVLTEPADADLFFRLGFRDVNLCWEDYAKTSYIASSRLQYWVWLGKHGADILARQLKSFEPGSGRILTAHFTFWGIGKQTARGFTLHDAGFMRPTILSLTKRAKSAEVLDTADSCQCECSLGGCTPLIYLLKAIFNFRFWDRTSGAPVWAEAFARYLECAGHILEPRHHAVALRFLTFQALQMRHRCCAPEYGVKYYFRRCPPCDVKEEVDEGPGYDRMVLEELLEEFEREIAKILQDQDRGIDLLVEFWKQTWVTRVTEAQDRLEGDALSDDERRRAEEIGVVWDKPAPEVVTGNPFDEDTEDYWFYELDKIEV